MTDPYSELQGATYLDPSNVMIGLGAVAAIVAAVCWRKVAKSITNGEFGVKEPDKHDLRNASWATSAAFGLVAVGYLFGQFFGPI